MIYVISNKIISFGGGSTVTDQYGNDLYTVKGKVFTVTNKKYICTLDRQVLYIVRNKFFSLFLPKVYITDPNGNKLLMIKKRSFFSFKQDFEVVTLDGSDHNYTITGDYFGWDFDLYDNGIFVAHVGRNFNLFKDSFTLETDLAENAPFYISFVIALDNYYDRLRKEKD